MSYWVLVVSLVTSWSVYNVDIVTYTATTFALRSQNKQYVLKTKKELLKRYDQLSADEKQSSQIFYGKEFQVSEQKPQYIISEVKK